MAIGRCLGVVGTLEEIGSGVPVETIESSSLHELVMAVLTISPTQMTLGFDTIKSGRGREDRPQ